MNYYGYNPPFFGGHQNVMSKQSGDRIIKNDILQLLLTMRGERVMRPTWGTIIKSSVMEGITDELKSDIVSDVVAALSRYEPRISATVTVDSREADENQLFVKVEGSFTNEPNHTFEIELDLPLQREE